MERAGPDLQKCVHQLIADRALLSPHAVAAADRNSELTFEELDRRANVLASRLCSLGVGPDVLVGLCLHGSVALVVGALGILKAGGAYLPMDPASPAERLALILRDAQPSVLVTGHCFEHCLPTGPWRLVALNEKGQLPESVSCASPPHGVTGENLAYVIYTSGSTGRPKGVLINHASLSNLVVWHLRAFDVKPSDRASQLAAVGFDAAVWELWPYLTNGAGVYIADEAIRNEPEALRDWLVSQNITISFVPTPLAEQLMALEWPSKTALRVMLTGADTLHHYPSRKLPFRLVNNYGPTECTVVATSGEVLPTELPDRPPTIGRPIANTQVYILDENLQRVPVGMPGELHLAGVGLSRGYLNQPELTAKKFIQSPFSSEPGARLYKTGDLAFFLPDGEIAFLGRIDDQVKVRGYRIEPNEIVSVLDQHPAVLQSVVLGRESVSGEKSLVAYFVAATDSNPTHSSLREFLRVRLPEYMVPTTFVKLPAFPLNQNGKVDRAALPAPDSTNIARDEAFRAPRTPVEERVAQILGPLLGLTHVGLEDNFFMLGGHSLLGTQLIARLRDIFGVQLNLRSLFDSPTVEKLSSEIERLLVEKLRLMSEYEAERELNLAGPRGR